MGGGRGEPETEWADGCTTRERRGDRRWRGPGSAPGVRKGGGEGRKDISEALKSQPLVHGSHAPAEPHPARQRKRRGAQLSRASDGNNMKEKP